MSGGSRIAEVPSLTDGESRLRGCSRRVEASTYALWQSVPAAYASHARLMLDARDGGHSAITSPLSFREVNGGTSSAPGADEGAKLRRVRRQTMYLLLVGNRAALAIRTATDAHVLLIGVRLRRDRGRKPLATATWLRKLFNLPATSITQLPSSTPEE